MFPQHHQHHQFLFQPTLGDLAHNSLLHHTEDLFLPPAFFESSDGGQYFHGGLSKTMFTSQIPPDLVSDLGDLSALPISPISPSQESSPEQDTFSDDAQQPSGRQYKNGKKIPVKYTETREERLAKNRISAAKSRKKKKAWVEKLNGQVEELTNQNLKLRTIVENLRFERDRIRQDLSTRPDRYVCTTCRRSSVSSSVMSNSENMDLL